MDTETQRRIARNQSLFREANEAIERGLWPGEEDRIVRFRCECSALDCNSAVHLTVDEYEVVRQHGRRFVVAVGHEIEEVEDVVERGYNHLVVEKLDLAGRVAESTDPRG